MWKSVWGFCVSLTPGLCSNGWEISMFTLLGIVPFVTDKCGYIGRFGSVSSVKRNIELMGIVHYKSITLFKRKVYTPMYGVAGFHPNFLLDMPLLTLY